MCCTGTRMAGNRLPASIPVKSAYADLTQLKEKKMDRLSSFSLNRLLQDDRMGSVPPFKFLSRNKAALKRNEPNT